MGNDKVHEKESEVADTLDWKQVVRLMVHSRAMDDKEEQELVPEGKVMYQFSARGHELGQILLGHQLTHPHDAASAYYRSRPLMLSLGLSLEDAMAAPMAQSGSYSDGRDIGVVCNKPGIDGPTVLPMAGDVGSQYTPGIGWAQGIQYHMQALGNESYEGAISVILGGDGSVATNGFWSALTIATTQNLPVLFYIEDNGYGISVPSTFQTPGGNIAKNLYSFKNLHLVDGDGTDPAQAPELVEESVSYVRNRKGPALLHLTMPRLNGHSYQDNQAYKSEELLQEEQQKDPLKLIESFLVPDSISADEWAELKEHSEEDVEEACQSALNRPAPDPDQTERYTFAEKKSDGSPDLQRVGGLAPAGHTFPKSSQTPSPGKQRINIVEGIRKTLDYELETNPKLVVFGEDVAAKGGVHAATMGLQTKYGNARVFDTSLSEEGIIGRAVGLAYSGLMPVAEIQFRKYADPATEQLNNCGTIRWRTGNKFAAPVVVRMPGGFAKCGDPWHSMCNEVFFVHAVGWQLAFPSNAQDAVGLLRSAMRSNNPTIFFEHRNLLDARYARRPYPGNQFIVPFGKAQKLQEGKDITIVTWGAMCERCEQAVDQMDIEADILDLRTLIPWDKQAVLESVQQTNRCLIVHEDTQTAGFGAEISAVLSQEAFKYLDASIERLTMPDIPMPHNVGLMNSVLPDAEKISDKIEELLSF
ncbi:alpha-ketoacid dehydrogenase subunit alpha/beta [Fodinibius salsisoli]|uniref:3-methyl-2-oxobutanoate dehydrogenase (2-methylpropanoyl-transferring) n=1 Tax=Fodinibius salsisoli TaxID=2820877 RepID=A0ABT3PJN4_9BACT|nr:transketolase C-terminal domain-containing protein [Fodinibius salsisoli]MCW9706158.1 pyruvate dehydrogenase [Fodinibius salsisoli]